MMMLMMICVLMSTGECRVQMCRVWMRVLYLFGVIGDGELQMWCWEPASCSLQEQYMLLITEPFLFCF